MATELKAFRSGGAVMSLDDIAKGLSNTLRNAPTVQSNAGAQFLKMRGPNDWVLGKEAEEIRPTDEFVVSITEFSHGYVAWHGGRPEFQAMIHVSQDLSTIALPDTRTLKAKLGIEDARGMKLAGLDELAGEDIVFTTNSRGGREAIEDLQETILGRIEAGEKKAYPVITLSTSGYIHPEHGPITKPVFNIVNWVTEAEAFALIGGEDQPQPEPAPKAKAKPAPEPEPVADVWVEVEEAEVVAETPPAPRRRRATAKA